MKYYSFLFFINIIFFLVWKFIDINLNIKLIFGLFDLVYILCIYVYRNQPDLYNKIINNCKKSENKPVILNSYNNIDPWKLYLILVGFHVGALAAIACFTLARPKEKYRFEFTTTSSNLLKRLGKVW